MELSRRTVLKGMAAAGSLAAAAVDLPRIARAAERAAAAARDVGGGVRTVKTTCCVCVNFCGIQATVQNGIVRTIYPDAACADYYNHGICPKGATGMFNVYDPYRLKKPLKRTNPAKGMDQDPRWVEISWEEAFSTIAEQLKKIRADDPAKLVLQWGQGKYLLGDQFTKAFADAFGTPNKVHRTTTCEAARHIADELTWGYHGFLPDLEHTTLLLNFGANYHEGEQWARWLDWATANGRERGLKVVVIEPRLSNCAAKADQWIPVRPGKDVVLIMALARLLIENGHIDEPFLVNYTNAPQLVGDDGRIATDRDGKTPLVYDTVTGTARPFTDGVKPALRGAWTLDGKRYRTAFQVYSDTLARATPEYAEEVAGVPAATVRELAAEIARHARIGATVTVDGKPVRYRPVAVHTFRGLAAKEYGVQTWRAGIILQLLIGGVDAMGGMLLNHPYNHPEYLEPAKAEYPSRRVDLAKSVFFPHATHDVAQQVNLTIADPKAYGLPYEPAMQLIYGTNRPVSTAEPHRQFEGMKRTFNVVIDVLMSETAWMADIVLPDKAYLESWHLSPTRSTPGASHTAIRQEIVNPFHLQHDAFSIFWELAKRVGIRDRYVAELNKQWKLKDVKFEPGRDYTARQAVEVLWVAKTGKDFQAALDHAFVGKKKALADRYLTGVEKEFAGPGKPKIKLYADQLLHTYDRVAETARKHGLALDLAKYRVALSPLPLTDHAFPTPHREATDYPFYLVTHKLMYRTQTGWSADNALINTLIMDENYVTINAATARTLGIKDGDLVVVESRVGRATGRARVVQGIRPDTVAISYHFGQFSPGYAPQARKGIYVNQVLELHPDLVAGMNSFNDTKVRVRKA
jgi:anaerobic selenocysteine-containing dehydrogenase